MVALQSAHTVHIPLASTTWHLMSSICFKNSMSLLNVSGQRGQVRVLGFDRGDADDGLNSAMFSTQTLAFSVVQWILCFLVLCLFKTVLDLQLYLHESQWIVSGDSFLASTSFSRSFTFFSSFSICLPLSFRWVTTSSNSSFSLSMSWLNSAFFGSGARWRKEQSLSNLQKPLFSKYTQCLGCLAVHNFLSQLRDEQISWMWNCLQLDPYLQCPNWWCLQTGWVGPDILKVEQGRSRVGAPLRCRSVDDCACFFWAGFGTRNLMLPGLSCVHQLAAHPHMPGSHRQSPSSPAVGKMQWWCYLPYIAGVFLSWPSTGFFKHRYLASTATLHIVLIIYNVTA